MTKELVVRITLDRDGFIDVETQDENGEWEPVPRYFFIADALQRASNFVYEGIDEDLKRYAQERD